MAVDWSDYDVYEPLIKSIFPIGGEGESKGEQLVTAVNKLIYKWYNDGDVFDNTGYMTDGQMIFRLMLTGSTQTFHLLVEF